MSVTSLFTADKYYEKKIDTATTLEKKREYIERYINHLIEVGQYEEARNQNKILFKMTTNYQYMYNYCLTYLAEKKTSQAFSELSDLFRSKPNINEGEQTIELLGKSFKLPKHWCYTYLEQTGSRNLSEYKAVIKTYHGYIMKIKAYQATHRGGEGVSLPAWIDLENIFSGDSSGFAAASSQFEFFKSKYPACFFDGNYKEPDSGDSPISTIFKKATGFETKSHGGFIDILPGNPHSMIVYTADRRFSPAEGVSPQGSWRGSCLVVLTGQFVLKTKPV